MHSRSRKDGAGDPSLYPIRAVVRLTGLAPDTLRAWERRYGATVPTRTEGNARRYSERDVSRLKLLRDAVAAGHSIGDIVALDDDALRALPRSGSDGDGDAADPCASIRNAVLDALERLDARACDEALARAAILLPPRVLALEILRPLLYEIGERWHAGRLSIAAEHLASAQIRATADRVRGAHGLARGAPRIVLAAPSEHRHELGLLLGSLIAVQYGVEPVVLGGDLPLAEIESAAKRMRASIMVLGIARALHPSERRLKADIVAVAKRREVWVGVDERHVLAKMPTPVRVITSLEMFDRALAHRFELNLPGRPRV